MTFYEAALAVLERSGKPLDVAAITELALKDNLLSHVGKSPDEVMQSRLLAMARRRNDRKIVAVAPRTYGLVEWALPEDPAALEPATEEGKKDEPPLRPRERHPAPSPEKARIAGRGDRARGKSRREEELEERKKRRRFPPLSEVAFEILGASGAAMTAVDIAAAAREKDLVSEDLGAEMLLNALREDNRRRIEAGRRPAFSFLPSGEVSLEKGAAPPAAAVELEAAVAYALGVPLTAEPKREERGPGAARLVSQVQEQRRQILRLVRRRAGDLPLSGLERVAAALLDAHGYREIRPVRRSPDAVLLSTRRREGLTELKCAVRVQRGGPEVTRAQVEELRREASAQGAALAVLLCPADVAKDARAEASASAPFVALQCGDAFAELCLEKRIGCQAFTLEVFDLDEAFFRQLRAASAPATPAPEEERKGERREGRPGRPEEKPARPEDRQREPRPAPTPSERERDAQALAERLIGAAPPSDPAIRARRQEEARVRAAAHERIEAAEAKAQGRSLPA